MSTLNQGTRDKGQGTRDKGPRDQGTKGQGTRDKGPSRRETGKTGKTRKTGKRVLILKGRKNETRRQINTKLVSSAAKGS